MAYEHGIKVEEKRTTFPQPGGTRNSVQVVIGTAPVHLSQDPYGATNVPIKAGNREEAERLLGYSDDWGSYTLCQSMAASFDILRASPVVFINVLDPHKHMKENAEKSYHVDRHQTTLDVQGALRDTVVIRQDVAENPKTFREGTDYILSYGDDGGLTVTLIGSGEAYGEVSLKASCRSVDPSMVTDEDIIGAYDVATGKETGLELVRQVYPRYQLVPSILLAPGWSHLPNVAAALQGKCEGINGVFQCECLLDLDTEKTSLYTDCAAVKERSGFTSPHAVVLWPMVTLGGKAYAYSAVYGAMASRLTLDNGDIPYLYPSNKALGMDGAVLKGGAEVTLDQVQAAALNGDGIVTAINDNGWRAWGNNTACYPANDDPKDRWIAARRMFSFVGNHIATTCKERIDGNMNRRTIDDIVNGFNIWGNSLAGQGQCAAMRLEYLGSDNATEDIMEGRISMQVEFAPYTPVEVIKATMAFDVDALKSALNIGNEG